MYRYIRKYASMKLSFDEMQASASDASELLKILANPHRLLILCALATGEKSVGQLVQTLAIRPSTASQHLAILRRERIVSTRREGQVIWYQLDSGPARQVMMTLYSVYCGPKDAMSSEGR